MTAYVRVRKLDDLVECIDATGTQVDVAAAAGLSVQRVNQLYTGAHQIIEVRKARRLEEALGVSPGALFTAVDGPLLAPYLHADSDDDDEPQADDDPPPVRAPKPPTVGATAA
jgi:transcriptional regulator with XRE-family HTH domain